MVNNSTNPIRVCVLSVGHISSDYKTICEKVWIYAPYTNVLVTLSFSLDAECKNPNIAHHKEIFIDANPKSGNLKELKRRYLFKCKEHSIMNSYHLTQSRFDRFDGENHIGTDLYETELSRDIENKFGREGRGCVLALLGDKQIEDPTYNGKWGAW